MQEEELGQGEDSVTIEDVTNNPAAQANLDDSHDQSIVEPDPDGHQLVRSAFRLLCTVWRDERKQTVLPGCCWMFLSRDKIKCEHKAQVARCEKKTNAA